MTEDDELTPLEVIIRNAMFVKTEVIKVMLSVAATTRKYNEDMALVDSKLDSDISEEAKNEIRTLRGALIERRAKYLTEVVMCQSQLRTATQEINEQLIRQVPIEKRVSLLLDFDQLVEDCKQGIFDGSQT